MIVKFGRLFNLILSHLSIGRNSRSNRFSRLSTTFTFNSYPNVTANWYESFSKRPVLSDVCAALLSVYDKSGLLELAQGLHDAGVRLLGSGGTAKKIREAGIPIG